MADFLAENPFLLLFLVAGVGYLVGRVAVLGFRLGVAAVLFVGLAVGALGPQVRLPDFVYLFGLIVFVYTVGLASGPGFFAALRRKGLRDNVLAASVLVMATGLVALAAWLLDLSGPQAGGLYAGSLTNTPALAAILEYLTDVTPAAGLDAALAEPVVAYSVAYPVGVLGVILAIFVLQRLWRTDYAAEAHQLRDEVTVGEELVDRTVRVRADLRGRTIRELAHTNTPHVLYGRARSPDGHQHVVSPELRLREGDLVTLIGTNEHVAQAMAVLGEEVDESLYLDRSELDFRRIFVSSDATVGRTIRSLDLQHRFAALATRVRRGDVDVLAEPDLRLLPGDRIRVVAPRDRIGEVSRFFGDSYRLLSEIDVGVFGLGITLGLLLGLVPVPLPGGGTFKLGLAGGPLVVGLVLGALVRTGPVVWQLPYNANLTLRQVGVILFLAGVGTRSGYSFASTVAEGGLVLFAAGVVITGVTAVTLLVVGHRALRIPMSLLIGMMSAVQTQPAVLAYANEQTGNELPNLGYASVFPVATVVKILAAQVLVVWL